MSVSASSDSADGASSDTIIADQARAEEQRYLDAMYQRLDAMRADAVQRQEDARFSSDGTPAGRFNRDALQHRYAQEVSSLDAAEDKLCFGRLDADDEIRHIGRMGMTDGTAERRQILIDWRAPVAAPFYTATTLEPQGVRRRRYLQTRRRRVTSVADEYLQSDAGAISVGSEALGAAGDSALLEALNAPRTGRMTDIIATIQAEQDRIIRSPRNGVLVVQGGPGTGKTVVALHRAAYLLYTHRERLGSHGVLVVGPNETFLNYIGQVLPSLGESSVVLSTIGTLFPGVTATELDDARATELKGRPMMATVIDNAILDRQRMPRRVRKLVIDHGTVRLEPGLLQKAQRRAWASRLPHNRARQVFLRVVLDGIARQIAGRPGVKQAEDAPEPDYAEIRKELTTDAAVVEALADLWPPLSPQVLIGELFSDERRLHFATPTLSPDQRKALLRQANAPWTVADVPLLDEAAELLGEVGTADRAWSQRRAEELEYAQRSLDALGSASAGQEDSGIGYVVGMLSAEDLADAHEQDTLGFTTADRAAADREWTYGHVVVDEAQELSPMAWRMVMRRCPVKSMTVVGDIAQTSDPAGATDWGKALRPHVGDRWRLEELTVNYRTPEEIMGVAAGVLRTINSSLAMPTSVRRSGFEPWALHVEPAELDRVLVDVVGAEVAEHAEGQLAVLVPDADRERLLAAVRTSFPSAERTPDPGVRVAVMGVREAKGLEFDAVIVVDPAVLSSQSRRGWGDVYVALTRATQRLGIVHTAPLPIQVQIPSIERAITN